MPERELQSQHPVFSDFRGWSGQAPEGLSVHWIGDKTPARFYGQPWQPHARSGVEYPPFDEEYFEWIDVLEGARDARGTFVFLELGAGYGRWSARAACAARQLGKSFRLGMAEAAPRHITQLLEVMEVNGINPSLFDVYKSAITARHETINFVVGWPGGKEPPSWYGQAITSNSMQGAELIGEHDGFPLWRMLDDWKVIKIPAMPLSEVIKNYQVVDVADFDLQGAEADAIEESLDLLGERVRRLHIGTHGHDIEARLREMLQARGWLCLRDYPCHGESDTPYGRIAFVDGVQSWINPKLQ